MKTLRRLWRWRVLSRAAHGDIDAMRELARKNDPDYIAALSKAFREVLGEDL